MMKRGLQVLGAPIDSEALAEGCNLTPGVLRAAGLIETLGAADLDVTICNPSLDPRRRYAPMIVSLLTDVFGRG